MNFDPVSMPKVELHCHLDGSLSKEFLMQTLQLSTLDMHTHTGTCQLSVTCRISDLL
ncbi:MAG: hypothetical protein ACLSHP_07840 [Coprococcus sp.]